MAKNDQNKDREDDDFFGDDDDFGLPELDYEALEEEDGDDEIDDFDDASFDDVDDDLGDDIDIDSDEFGDMDSAFEDEEEKEVVNEKVSTFEEDEAETRVKKSGKKEDDFFGEESFDDFDTSEEVSTDDIDESDFDDSVFDSDVLDEDEFKQFEKELMDSEGEFSGMDSEDTFDDEDDYRTDSASASKSKFTRIVVVGILIFLTLGVLFWYLAPSFTGGEEKQVAQQQEDKKTTPTPTEDDTEENTESTPTEDDTEEGVSEANTSDDNVAEEPRGNQETTTGSPKAPAKTNPQPSPKRQPVKTSTAAVNPGEITKLTERTNSFYVIIGSFVDEDLAMDHSKDLVTAGKSPMIIPPFGKAITYRVAIQGYGSLIQAQGALEGFRSEYGQDAWVLKY